MTLAAALAVAAGCSPPARQPTITQGVFGEARSGCDTLTCLGGGWEGAKVSLFTSNPRPTDGGSAPLPAATATSDHDGFFELSADAGTYFLGIANVNSTQIEIAAGRTVEWNFTAGPGGGQWHKGP